MSSAKLGNLKHNKNYKDMKYYKCKDCNSILETCVSCDLECLNCLSKNLTEITEDAPQWVKGCNICEKKNVCEKIGE